MARPEHRFTWVDGVTRFLSYARYRNAHRWGIYMTPSLLKRGAGNRRKESFQERQLMIYVDCDQRECVDRIQARYPFPTLVVRTSQGRHQVYWRLDQPVTILQQEQLMSAIARDIDADPAATDVSRVLRLPGFWNRKPNRNNTVDIVFTRRQTVSYQSLWQALQQSSMVPSDSPIQTELEPALPRADGSSMVPSASPTQTSTLKNDVSVSECFPPSKRPSQDGNSESERDWYQVHRRLAFGDRPEAVIQWLQQKRRDKRNPKYYAELTVRKAVAARGG